MVPCWSSSWSSRAQQPVVQVDFAKKLTADVVSDVSQPRTTVMSRCDDEMAVSRHQTTSKSTNKVAMTTATRALEPARSADPDQVTHDEPEIEAHRHESAGASEYSCGRADACGASPRCHRDARTSVR